MKYNRLKIGDFSRLCRVTVRTLRHYEAIHLLAPEIVDDFTGYRYYSFSQFQKMQQILQLKELGYSLEEIRSLWDEDSHMPSDASLEEKIRCCEQEQFRLSKRHAMLQAMIDSRKKIEQMNTIQIEALPAMIVASHRTILPAWEDLGPLCCEVIGPEMARLGCECPEPGYCYTTEHGGYKPQNIDIEYCEQVVEARQDSAIIQFKHIPAVKKAACMKVYGPYDQYSRHYTDLFAWIEQEGYKIAGAPRCCYIDGIWNQDDPARWLSIIQVPVE